MNSNWTNKDRNISAGKSFLLVITLLTNVTKEVTINDMIKRIDEKPSFLNDALKEIQLCVFRSFVVKNGHFS